MQLHRRQVPTGTFCGGNHREQIEYRYALVDGVEVPDGQAVHAASEPVAPTTMRFWSESSAVDAPCHRVRAPEPERPSPRLTSCRGLPLSSRASPIIHV
jgi:hypothetical protein